MSNNFCLHCKFFAGKTLEWMVNNKMIVFLGLLSFSLFVSTLALAGQRNRALAELADLRTSTVSPPTTDQPTTIPSTIDSENIEQPSQVTPESETANNSGLKKVIESDASAENKTRDVGADSTVKSYGLDEDFSGKSKLLEVLGAFGSAQ